MRVASADVRAREDTAEIDLPAPDAAAAGSAATKFIQMDRYVAERLRALLVKRAGSRLPAGRADVWRRPFFEAFGLYRLRGTIQYPGRAHATT